TRTVRYEGADVAVDTSELASGHSARAAASGALPLGGDTGRDSASDLDELSLLDVARRVLGVRSASRGCDDGRCGACRLIVDGALVNACGSRWADIREGAVIEAYEQLASEPAAVRAVDAFAAERPTRCRLCVGALGVTAAWLARRGKEGDRDAIDETLTT